MDVSMSMCVCALICIGVYVCVYDHCLPNYPAHLHAFQPIHLPCLDCQLDRLSPRYLRIEPSSSVAASRACTRVLVPSWAAIDRAYGASSFGGGRWVAMLIMLIMLGMEVLMVVVVRSWGVMASGLGTSPFENARGFRYGCMDEWMHGRLDDVTCYRL